MRPRLFWQRCGILFLVLALAGCASLTVTKSAETLNAVGESFLSSAQQIDAAYKAKIIPEADYQRWREFVPKFRLAFTQADQALRTARAAGDVTTPQQTADLILALKNQLLTLVLQIYAPAAKGGTP